VDDEDSVQDRADSRSVSPDPGVETTKCHVVLYPLQGAAQDFTAYFQCDVCGTVVLAYSGGACIWPKSIAPSLHLMASKYGKAYEWFTLANTFFADHFDGVK